MASTIKIKRSSVPSKVPTTSDIATGELAINTKDRKIYSSNGTSVFSFTSDYLQVANATALISAGGATWAALTSTNTAIRLLVSDRLQVANAASIYATQISPTTSGVLAHTGRATISTNLTVSGNNVIGKLVANGSLGTAGYALKTNGTTVYWDAVGGGGGSTTQYLQVANAVAIYQTKAVERAALANTNLAITNVKTGLTTTNTAIRLLVSDRLQVANAVSTFQTKAVERAALANTNLAITNVKTGLTTTNTSIRTLVSDRLQVANAVSTFQTKAVERAALANTNLAIINVKTGLTSTNTAIRALDTAKLSVANAVSIYVTKSNPTTSGLLAHTGRATISTNLTVSGNSSLGTIINTRFNSRVNSAADYSGTLTPNSDSYDMYAATGLTQATTIAAPTGTPVDGQRLMFRLLDNGTARALTWNATYTVMGVTLPTTTTASKTSYIGCVYNSNNTRWDVIAAGTQA